MYATITFIVSDSQNQAVITGTFQEGAGLKARVQKRADDLCKWLHKDVTARIVGGSMQLLLDHPNEYCHSIVDGK